MLQAVAQNSQELLLQLKRSQQGVKQPEISLMPRFSMNHPLELRRKNLSQGRCPRALGRVRLVAVPGSVPEQASCGGQRWGQSVPTALVRGSRA